MMGVPDQEPEDIVSQDYAEGYAEDKSSREDDQVIEGQSFWALMAKQAYLLEQKHILEADGKRNTPEMLELAKEIKATNQLLWQ